MKYGLLYFKKTKNIGDDIQSYAQSKFLPKIDYFVDREEISSFKSKNDEPVAVIMNAWWMWKKWNWPPSKNIIPFLISLHFTEWTTENWGSAIKFEILDGVGKAFLNAYGPVGCRDLDTLEIMRENGIDSYFSGCMTLTLPKMKKKKIKKKYVCVVDVDNRVLEKVKSEAKKNNLEIKILTHDLPEENCLLSWKQRKLNVEKILTIYQNAECVITSRLHVSLPCLSLETPVLLVRNDRNESRFKPYIDLCHFMTIEDFLNNKYDIASPLKNKTDYLKIRQELINKTTEFINKTKEMNGSLNDIIKTKYTDEEVREWQFNLMRDALEKWFYKSREMLSEYNKTIEYLRGIEKQIDDIKNSTSWKVTKPLRSIKEKITIKRG